MLNPDLLTALQTFLLGENLDGSSDGTIMIKTSQKPYVFFVCACVYVYSLTASLSKASWKSRRRRSWYCLSWKIRFCRSTSFCCFICISCTAILFSCCVCRIKRLTICSSRTASCRQISSQEPDMIKTHCWPKSLTLYWYSYIFKQDSKYWTHFA